VGNPFERRDDANDAAVEENTSCYEILRINYYYYCQHDSSA